MKRAKVSFSDPGAPPEPQRTSVTIGVARTEHAALLHAATRSGFMAQEALEPRFRQVRDHQAIPDLITGAIDIAVIDLATLLGERSLGWDGIAVAAFGPATDRSVGVAVVERRTWANRSDLCERLARACDRAQALDGGGPDVWPSCRPSPAVIDGAARWAESGVTAGLAAALAWSGDAD